MAAPRLYWQPKSPALLGSAFSNPFLRWIQIVGEYLGWYAVEITFSKVTTTPFIGQLYNISDSTSATPGDIVVGGGAFHILARWDGTNWIVTGGSSGGGGVAPANAQFLVATANAALTAERVATNTATVTWDFGTAAQAKANVPDDAITDAKLRESAGLSVIGRSGNTTGNPADIAAASDFQVLRRSGTAIAFGAVNLASSNAVTGNLAVANLGNGTTTMLTSSVTGTNNNYAPGVLGDSLISWSGASDATFTGVAGGVSGAMLTIKNTGSANLFLAYQSGSSTAGNRFLNMATSASTPIGPKGCATFVYDAQWVLVSHDQGSAITATFSATDYVGNASMTWTVASGDRSTLSYLLKGKVLQVVITLATTTIGGTLSNFVKVLNGQWGGFTSVGQTLMPQAYMIDNGVTTSGVIEVPASQTYIMLYRQDVANFTASADNTYFTGTVFFEVA